MALIIEDGSGVVGANSYASLDEARAYASARGLSFPVNDVAGEAALVLACDKLETYRYKGSKVDPAQALLWPRAGVYLEDADEAFAENSIPDRLKQAQSQFAIEAAAGTDLQPTGTGREVVREKVDVLEVEYAQRGAGTLTPQFNKAEALLSPLLSSTGSFGISTVRL